MAPACTGPFCAPIEGVLISPLGPGPGASPNPLPEGEVLALQQTFYKAQSSIGSYGKKKNGQEAFRGGSGQGSLTSSCSFVRMQP